MALLDFPLLDFPSLDQMQQMVETFVRKEYPEFAGQVVVDWDFGGVVYRLGEGQWSELHYAISTIQAQVRPALLRAFAVHVVEPAVLNLIAHQRYVRAFGPQKEPA